MHLTEQQLKQILINAQLSPNKKNLYAKCPKCGKNEFGISLKGEHRFGCFRKSKCGFRGNIFTLLSFLGISFSEYSEGNYVNLFQDSFDLLGEDIVKEGYESIEELLKSFKEIKPPILWRRVYEDDYFEERGLEPYQFEKHQLGRSKLKPNYVTILIEMNHKIVGYLTRSQMTKEWHNMHPEVLRYDNSKATDFQNMLGGWDEIVEGLTETVILVEGFFDKTSVEKAIGEIDEIKCCCTFGGHLTDNQIKLLRAKRVKNVVLLFEVDILLEIIKVSEKIGSKFHTVLVGRLPEGKDPNDLCSDQILDVLNAAEEFVQFRMNSFTL